MKKFDEVLTTEEMVSLASLRLAESGEDEEQWSLLFRHEGPVEFAYLPGWLVTGMDFLPEDYGWFDVEISDERRAEISAGAKPAKEEIAAWQYGWAAWELEGGSNTHLGFILPIYHAMKVQGYAVIDAGHNDDPNVEPGIVGCFQTKKEAIEFARESWFFSDDIQ